MKRSSLLQQSWEAKSSAFPKSKNTDALFYIYDKAISSGASCGKLLGAGGGGFFAFFVKPSKHDLFMKKMDKDFRDNMYLDILEYGPIQHSILTDRAICIRNKGYIKRIQRKLHQR